jgi:hypothetical protein
LEGLSLDERRKKLKNEINQINKYNSRPIEVSRVKFLEEIFEIAKRDMRTGYSVKFIK